MDPGSITALLSLLATLGTAIASATGNDPFGKKGGNEQIPRYTPEQQAAQNQILQRGLGGLGNLQQPFDFSPIEQQAKAGFYGSTVPGLAERFTALGGGQRSSAFQGALGSAGSGLDRDLASLKSQIGLQQQGRQDTNTLGLLNAGLGQQFDTRYNYRQPGILEKSNPGILEFIDSYFKNNNKLTSPNQGGASNMSDQGLSDLLALRTAELGNRR